MTLLFFHKVFPEDPLIYVVFFSMMGLSGFLIIRGIVVFPRSPNKAKLMLAGTAIWALAMIPSLIGDHPVLPTLPFGFSAGLIPYIVFNQGPFSPGFDLFATAVGCALNVIAIFSLVDLTANLFRRVFGKQDLKTMRLP